MCFVLCYEIKVEQSGQPEFVLTATNCELGWVPQLLRISVSMTVKWGQSQDLLLVVVSHGSFHVKPLAQYLTCIRYISVTVNIPSIPYAHKEVSSKKESTVSFDLFHSLNLIHQYIIILSSE